MVTSAVILENELGEAVITLPDEIIAALDLKENDTLVWEVLDGAVHMRKVV